MATSAQDIRRKLPKMDKVLSWPEITALNSRTSHIGLKNAVRSTLDQLRLKLISDADTDCSPDQICSLILNAVLAAETPSLRRVINGSGVVVHTNLGRSPLAQTAELALHETAWGYSNLEFDLERGERGERYVHIEKLLCELTGAEAALVVNNNAAAVMLALSSLASGREVIVSRGELVEIGGSFRIPDVMRQSGASLVEVGTTNRTHPRDYISALTDQTALLMKIHTSNFSVMGFTAEVDTGTMVRIGRESAIPTLVDAGSGCLIDLSRFGISGEATIQQQLQAGADIVTFSGDKLLGGPQAGLIVGKRELIDTMKRHQLLRALRIDKLTLAAMEATLRLYRDERIALAQIPTLRMLTMTIDEIGKQARRMLKRLRAELPDQFTLTLQHGFSSPGGGSFPLLQLPSRMIEVTVDGLPAHHLEERLRSTTPPVIGRLQKDRFLLDVRTLTDNELPLLAAALRQAAGYNHV
jgi:L-seryl-tRNA(Ser) seleniumtransferase